MANKSNKGKRNSALRIVAGYLLFGGLWIFFSDRLLLYIAANMQDYLMLQTYKGWIYVVCTAVLLYLLGLHEFHARDEIENELENSLHEKDKLMQELHHRVKNNLQLIMSLLNLHRTSGEINVLSNEVLEKLSLRIHSIAVFHEKVYHMDLFSTIPLDKYMREILSNIHMEYPERMRQIQIELSLSRRSFSIEQAVPLGIIFNELLVNSISHAFPPSFVKNAYIKIGLNDEEEQTKLIVEDNGIGFDPQLIEKSHSGDGGLGYTLVDSLLKQIDGTMDIRRNNGTTVEITVPYLPLSRTRDSESVEDKYALYS